MKTSESEIRDDEEIEKLRVENKKLQDNFKYMWGIINMCKSYDIACAKHCIESDQVREILKEINNSEN